MAAAGRRCATSPAARVWPTSYCEGGACASAVFSRYREHLADHDLPRAERLLALRIVAHVHVHVHVHVLGDVHEPLHAACDTDFVKRAVRGESEAGFAHRPVLRHREDRGAIEGGDIAGRMQESYAIAARDAYARLPGFTFGCSPPGLVPLPIAYSDAAAAIVEERLADAGIRLAEVPRATL